jgi:hypothetical protein
VRRRRAKAEVLGENHAVDVGNGEFNDEFAARGVHQFSHQGD